jgi:hypothetical protein
MKSRSMQLTSFPHALSGNLSFCTPHLYLPSVKAGGSDDEMVEIVSYEVSYCTATIFFVIEYRGVERV